MKTTAQTKRQPSKETAKQPRNATPVRAAKKSAPPAKADAPLTVAPKSTAAASMPDLTTFGVDARDAQSHVDVCEHCGRAYRHVVKNPKDAMALQSFGRNLAVCLAGGQAKASA
jgi:hypothetical protein